MRRTHKDKLFRFIFRDRKNLLQLYNALNGSDYQDEASIEIITLENIIYLGYKNDMAFLLDWVMFLGEHQSTWNPNMPLRGLLYFSRLYQDFISTKGYDLYKNTLIPLPCPQYVVFYNGTEPRPDRELLFLSDAFQIRQNGSRSPLLPSLECRALVLNINYGHNRELMDKCRPLWEYSCFIHYVRENLQSGLPPEDSVDLAVQRCLKENVLTDTLRAHKREVVRMFLEEYDQELHERTLRSEGLEQGLEEGREEIVRLIQFLFRDNREEDLRRSVENKEFRQQLLKEYGIIK